MIVNERPIDRAFASFICRIGGGRHPREELGLLVSTVSAVSADGSVCLDLSSIAGETILFNGSEKHVSGMETLRELLERSGAVGRPGERFPLILDESGRLYLYRFWKNQHDLAHLILSRVSAEAVEIDEARLASGLLRLFPPLHGQTGKNLQCRAAENAVRRRFSVISGGPGTGKTSTVTDILALLGMQPEAERNRIAITAPTGKAAARLKSAIRHALQRQELSETIGPTVPDEVQTLHRLLGTVARASRFRYHGGNPLPFDTVILDEASMVALPLMSALFEALRPSARLLLLGDRDQLASVEAGAVLADICTAGEQVPGSELADSITILRHNYRFGEHSGIAALSRAVNAGEVSRSLDLLRSGGPDGSLGLCFSAGTVEEQLASKIVDGYRSFLGAESPAEALDRLDGFRVLCALREGPYGSSGLNRSIAATLERSGFLALPSATQFRKGVPVLVTVNDYAMQLFNGDVGVCFPDPHANGRIRVFFPLPEGGMRAVVPERIAGCEPAFAMTVHKSQGSEFRKVLLVLPPEPSAVLSRELLYTAVTRARERVELFCRPEILRATILNRTERRSGLVDYLRAKTEEKPL